jgi:GDPmannose 4,6-dehydratase
MSRILISGVTGQDGSYLLDRLVDEDVELWGLVRPGDPGVAAAIARAPGLRIVTADLADTAKLTEAIELAKPDEFYHLAGISSVALSWKLPVETGAVTGLAAVAAMSAALNTNPGCKIVLASSGEVFAGVRKDRYNEDSEFSPVTPYGAAKAYAHQMARVFRSTGSHVAVTVLFNHESPRRPETFVTRKITATAARIACGLESTIVLGKLDARRDWGWAPDYVDAMMRAARHDRAEDFVIATGTTHSVQEFAMAALVAAGVDDPAAHIATDPRFERVADAPTLVGDPSKAFDVLGWAPTLAFDEIVAAMVGEDLRLAKGFTPLA